MATVLLCDDEAHILRAAEFKLSRCGFDVVCARDGEAGWEIIQSQTPDIVLTDCQMPRLDGIGLAKRIADDPRFKHLPVFLVTAKGFELSEIELQQKYDVRGVIAKPFSPRELAARVEQTLNEISEAVS